MSATAPEPPGFLHGLNVLELGDGVAGATAGAILASLGARVSTVVDPRASYRHGRPGLADQADASLLGLLLQRDKDILAMEDELGPGTLESLLECRSPEGAPEFDLVIADRVSAMPRGLESLSRADDFCAFVLLVNPNAWVTISAFGLSGPRRNDFATELTIAAVSGILDSVRDSGTGHPLKLAGYQCLLSAGQAAALAASHALDLALHGGPVHLDLSAQEATIATGPMLALAQQLLNAGGQMGARRYGAPSGFYPCNDGVIRVSAMEDHQWRGVVTAMGSPDWAEEFSTTAARIEDPSVIDARMADWTRPLAKAEAEARLQAEGVPATALYSPAEILRSPQLAHRDAIERSEISPGVAVESVGRPFQAIRSKRAAGAERRTRRGLAGLRVAEAGHVLAVPLAAALLGALGAKVTKVEDVNRIDMYRRRAPFIDGEEGTNRAAYFAMVNHSKRSITVDLDADVAPLFDLVDNSDVVMENLGRRRSDRLGISASALARSGRDLLALSSSGFGHDGPQAEYRAYAYNLQTSFGLFHLTRNEAGDTAEMDMAWADLVSGYAIATIVAAWAVGPEGNGPAGIDFAMAETVAARFNEFLAAASIDPESDTKVDRANEVSPAAPNGVYRARDGWVALSVGDDASFTRLRAALGEPASLDDPRFSSAERRFRSRFDLDVAVECVIADVAAADLVTTLRSVGLIVEVPIPPARLADDEHLVDRGFFTTVEHPEWGSRGLIGIPWRPEGRGALPLAPPPCLRVLDSSLTGGVPGPLRRSAS
jgi:crotonobetainyl-CoA:carnitine CoA-transferase CaiB-like acyl-CoA transferase